MAEYDLTRKPIGSEMHALPCQHCGCCIRRVFEVGTPDCWYRTECVQCGATENAGKDHGQ